MKAEGFEISIKCVKCASNIILLEVTSAYSIDIICRECGWYSRLVRS